MAVNPYRRLTGEIVDIDLPIGNGVHHFSVGLYRDAAGCLREINFVGRGKVGHGIDQMFRELGIQLSRAIQGRSPLGDPSEANGLGDPLHAEGD